MSNSPAWPEGRSFAFTIFDDTDYATLENVRPVYDFLSDHGYRITKSVWPLAGTDEPLCSGSTCQDKPYLQWLHELETRGFEIGYHMTTYHSSTRKQTERGLEEFKRLFGAYPSAMANHSGCLENIYWGDARLSGLNAAAYNLLTGYRFRNRYGGHLPDSKYFWGDLCRGKITYVRNFILPEINCLKAVPFMPYHDSRRPYVNFWYPASEGPELGTFNNRIIEEAQDRLEAEGGACIMYTHLACGFCENGRLDGRFKSLMDRLSKKNGWLVPVSTLLNYLRQVNGNHTITDRERRQLERRWLRHKLRVGRS